MLNKWDLADPGESSLGIGGKKGQKTVKNKLKKAFPSV